MKLKMTLLSDTIPGNGESIPGGEDISVLHDAQGFPYYKGGTMKGIFREELGNYLAWSGKSEAEARKMLDALLGYSGDTNVANPRRLRFSDFTLSEMVRQKISGIQLQEYKLNADDVLKAFSYVRTFTAIDENGTVLEGSLRYARCLKKDLVFYGEIQCSPEDEKLVTLVLELVKWIGTMRNRGFGQVRIERV